MKTILTKVIPSTNTRPYRIKALIHGEAHSDNLVVTQGEMENAGVDSITGEEAHRYAAKKLADKIKWQGDFASGYLAGNYVHLFAPNVDAIKLQMAAARAKRLIEIASYKNEERQEAMNTLSDLNEIL